MKKTLLIILDILLIIVCLYFGILGLIFKDEYKKEEPITPPTKEEEVVPQKEEEKPIIIDPVEIKVPTITEEKFDTKVNGVEETLTYNKNNMDEMTLFEAFSLKKLTQEIINYSYIKNLKQKDIGYTKLNGIDILIWPDGFIKNKTIERTVSGINSNGNTVSLAKINNYYMVVVKNGNNSTLIIYDLKFKKVKEYTINSNMASPTLYKNYIFFGVDACNKKRFDDSYGSVIQIYSFGTYSGKTKVEFNIDNNSKKC